MSMRELQYAGFSPTEDIRELAQRKLEQILEESPSDATGMIKLVMKRGAFEGILKIHALAGAFVSRTIKGDPRVVIESLVEDVRAQVARWKKLRFLP
jgi:hypothetical protein